MSGRWLVAEQQLALRHHHPKCATAGKAEVTLSGGCLMSRVRKALAMWA
jgi:hypothetical protein